MESSNSAAVSSYVVVESHIPEEVRACIAAAFLNPAISGSVPPQALAKVVIDTNCRSVLSTIPKQGSSNSIEAPSTEEGYVPDFSSNFPTTVLRTSLRKQSPYPAR